MPKIQPRGSVNFASVWINGLDGRLVVRVRDGEFPAACGLRQAITLAIHRQYVDVVGQPVEDTRPVPPKAGIWTLPGFRGPDFSSSRRTSPVVVLHASPLSARLGWRWFQPWQ